METSQRIKKMREPALLKYYPIVNEAQKKGKKVYFLNIGQPDIKTPEGFLNSVNGIDQKVLSYQAPEGITELREAACGYYERLGLDYDINDLFVTNGGSEALLFTFIGICNAGDEILTAEPLYSIYKEMAAATDVNLVGFKTYAEDGFALPDASLIEAAITPRTKAILMTNPGNPTGKVFTKKEIEVMVKLALKHNLYLISDEVYREFVYDKQGYLSPAQYQELSQNFILIDSISKRYSACGARIGFIVSKNKVLMGQLKKLCQMRLAVSTVDQIGAISLLNLDEHFFDGILKEYTQRRKIVYEALQKISGVICKEPRGAFYFMAKLPIKDASHFIEWMINDFDYQGETVLLSPANDFYLNPEDGADEVRIAYVLNGEDMRKGMTILKYGLEAYRLAFPEVCK
ncbi:pyridoxal phosphate-dependent aminotransferase [Acetobacterium tundrae]|uniref:Aminotransferase n=1 Tax=Acetobacterium tundrae TaxID=132932 RepID=A0ABR6WMC4_9FIRM|nr:pyridoxal phosphate-dependent aminotransferase [Acetobacterium tundrae]MBC3797630.1 aminotransferase class I/II-fold pyridoxal phosphate-dependent enzyme [Acetobacterium tundrae]